MNIDSTPSARVYSLVQEFLEEQYLSSQVEVAWHTADNGEPMLAVEPKKADAAGLLVRISGMEMEDYLLHVFIGNDGSPIEVVGPLNTNSGPPFVAAMDELVDILKRVASGEAYEEFDFRGESLGTNLDESSVSRDVQPDAAMKRRYFAPWH